MWTMWLMIWMHNSVHLSGKMFCLYSSYIKSYNTYDSPVSHDATFPGDVKELTLSPSLIRSSREGLGSLNVLFFIWLTFSVLSWRITDRTIEGSPSKQNMFCVLGWTSWEEDIFRGLKEFVQHHLLLQLTTCSTQLLMHCSQSKTKLFTCQPRKWKSSTLILSGKSTISGMSLVA